MYKVNIKKIFSSLKEIFIKTKDNRIFKLLLDRMKKHLELSAECIRNNYEYGGNLYECKICRK